MVQASNPSYPNDRVRRTARPMPTRIIGNIQGQHERISETTSKQKAAVECFLETVMCQVQSLVHRQASNRQKIIPWKLDVTDITILRKMFKKIRNIDLWDNIDNIPFTLNDHPEKTIIPEIFSFASLLKKILSCTAYCLCSSQGSSHFVQALFNYKSQEFP